MTTTDPNHKHKFLMLDALRGIAAMSVVVFHYTDTMFGHSWKWPPSAYLAVDFFFLLSGFVVMHAYAKRLKQGMTTLQFLIVRLIRLYPLYFLGTSITIAASLITAAITRDMAAISMPSLSDVLGLAFLPTPPSLAVTEVIGSFPYNTPSWSLSLEMAINLVFAMICMRMTTKRWSYVVAAGGMCLIGSMLFYQDAAVGWDWDGYLGGVARILFSFFAGVLLYKYHQEINPANIRARWGVVLSCALFALFVIPHDGIIYPLAACLLFFPLVVWYAARVTVNSSMAKLCTVSGRLSYVIYITHKPLTYIFIGIVKSMGIDPFLHSRSWAVIFTVCALLIAILLDRFYDVPIRTYLGEKFRLRHAR